MTKMEIHMINVYRLVNLILFVRIYPLYSSYLITDIYSSI